MPPTITPPPGQTKAQQLTDQKHFSRMPSMGCPHQQHHEPVIRTLHLQHILSEVNVSTVSPLELQAAAADDNAF